MPDSPTLHQHGRTVPVGGGPSHKIDPRVWDSLPVGLILFDGRLRVIRHNPAAAFLLAGQNDLGEALTRNTTETRQPGWPDVFRQILQDGTPQRFERIVFQREPQDERVLNLQCIPLTDPIAQVATVAVLIVEDVTDKANLEQRVETSERMAAVGKLIARVAHELNNPLDGILRYLNLALRLTDTGRTDKVGTYLARARDGLLRMADILRELVDFSRGSPSTFDETDINSLVEESVKVMADKAARSNVSIVCTFDRTVPAVAGTSLFQVFCNLVKNAIEAMPDGGTLTITTQRHDDEVWIRFEDTGVGLPEPVETIFEPFFTTKPPGQGTGLGLAICKDILDKYQGRIVPSNTPQGAAFDVFIPLTRCRNHRTTQDRVASGSSRDRSATDVIGKERLP